MVEDRLATLQRYNESPKGRATALRYRNKPERKEAKRNYHHSPKYMMMRARNRANRLGRPFSLTVADIPTVPKKCPVLGIVLAHGVGKQERSSPSMDCICPELGYVPGNVRIISHRANWIKNDATWQELLAVGEDLRKIMQHAENKETL